MIELAKPVQKNEEDIKNEITEEVNNEIKEEKKEEKKVEENLQKIYIGPTIAAFSLQENTIFVNEYPFNVQEAIKKYPLTEKLFINVEDLKSRNNEYYKTLYNTLNNELRGNINGI
ncbi:hypothetical protein [Fusobacterium nucleatum]|uniref:hypothetical protein n=1 Tax=Fusobacterium nucleatum TaxID=851 RepID=UPI0030CF90F7